MKYVAEQARLAQNELPFDRNPLLILPVPSRDDSRTEFARAADWQRRFVKAFGEFYKEWLPTDIEPVDVVEKLRIPYIPYWSFEEALPVVEEGTSDPSSIGHAYEVLARLVFFNLSWREIDKNPEKSVEYLQRATSVDMNRFGPDLADALFDRALALWKESLTAESIEATRGGVEIWEKLAVTDLRSYGLKLARSKNFLSELLQDSDEQEAMSHARDAIDAYRNLYQIDDTKFREEIATGLAELSERVHEKEPEIAIDNLSYTIDILRRLARSNPRFDVELARTLYDLTNWYIEEKQFSAGLASAKEAVSIYRRLMSVDKQRFEPDLADSLITLSECFLETGNLEDALANGYDAVEIYKQLAKSDPRRNESGLVKTFNALLDIISRADIRGTQRALTSIQEAVVFFRSLAARDPRRYEADLAKTLNMLPDPLSKEGKLEEALAAQEEAIEILKRLSLSNPARYEHELAENLVSLSRLLKMHDATQSQKIAKEAVEILERLSKSDSARYEEDLKEALGLVKIHGN